MQNEEVAKSLHKVGKALFQHGDRPLAIEYIFKALEIEPKLGDAYNDLSSALFLQGKINESLECIRLAIKFNKNSTQVARNAKDIYQACSNIKTLSQEEQIQTIINLQEEDKQFVNNLYSDTWDKTWFKDTIKRWLKQCHLARSGPAHSAKAKQNISGSSDSKNDFYFANCPLCKNDTYKIFYNLTKPGYSVVQCIKCNFLYRNPVYTKEKIEKVYNKDYLQFLNGPYSKNRQKIYRTYLSALDFNKQTADFSRPRLLDIGCGFGLFLQTMQDTDWQLFGLDFAKDCIQFARKKFGFKNVFCGNLEEDSFEEEYFDVVTLWSVAAHLEDPLGMFRKINRVLKPGGLLIIYTVDSSSITHKEKLSNWGGFTGNHLIFFNPESLSRALMHSGFEVTKCVFDQLFSKYNNGQIDPKDLPFFQKLAKQHNLGTMMALSSKKICPIYES